MAKTALGSDMFANIATITVTESAANTITYKKLETGISLMDKVAWIINRVEYHLTFNIGSEFANANDGFAAGLAVANTVSSLYTAAGIIDPTILDLFQLQRVDLGTAASGAILDKIYTKDLSTLPGGGLIVPPTPLYGVAMGSGLTNATTTVLKIYYTLLSLAPDQYWQLVEARRVISS